MQSLECSCIDALFTIQITRLGLVVNTAFKMIDKINLQSDGIIKKLCKNMNLRKVENIEYTILIKYKIYIKAPLLSTKDLFLDYKTGFGGKFGVQKDRVDKSAVKSYEETGEKIGTNYEKTRPDGKIMVQSYGFVT